MASSSHQPIPSSIDKKLVLFFAGQVTAVSLVGLLLQQFQTLARWLGEYNLEALVYLIWGIPFAQASLLAAWNALSGWRPGPIGSVVCLMLIWLFCFAVPYYREVPGPRVLPAVTAIALLAQWLVVQLPLWFVRLSCGIRIEQETGWQTTPTPRGRRQFGIMYLLVWTTVVACLLGVARYFVPSLLESRGRDYLEFGVFLACNAACAWPTALGGLLRRFVRPAVFAAAVVTVMVSWFEPHLFAFVSGSRGVSDPIFFCLNGAQFLWLLGSLLILRRMGFRLLRVSSTK